MYPYKINIKTFYYFFLGSLESRLMAENPLLYIDAKCYRPFPNSTFMKPLNFFFCRYLVLPARGAEELQCQFKVAESLSLPAFTLLGRSGDMMLPDKTPVLSDPTRRNRGAEGGTQ